MKSISIEQMKDELNKKLQELSESYKHDNQCKVSFEELTAEEIFELKRSFENNYSVKWNWNFEKYPLVMGYILEENQKNPFVVFPRTNNAVPIQGKGSGAIVTRNRITNYYSNNPYYEDAIHDGEWGICEYDAGFSNPGYFRQNVFSLGRKCGDVYVDNVGVTGYRDIMSYYEETKEFALCGLIDTNIPDEILYSYDNDIKGRLGLQTEKGIRLIKLDEKGEFKESEINKFIAKYPTGEYYLQNKLPIEIFVSITLNGKRKEKTFVLLKNGKYLDKEIYKEKGLEEASVSFEDIKDMLCKANLSFEFSERVQGWVKEGGIKKDSSVQQIINYVTKTPEGVKRTK